MDNAATYTVIAVPHNGLVQGGTARCLTLLASHSAYRGIPYGYCDAVGSSIAQSRHNLVKKALQNPRATHILFLDADMLFPMNTLERLLMHDLDIVAANCTTRMEPIVPVAFGLDGKRMDSRKRRGVEECRQVGCAVMLAKLDVFRRLKPPFFLQDWIPDMQAYCGEDVFMCQVVQGNDVKVHIDHDLSRWIKHVGAKDWGWEHVAQNVGDLTV